MGGIGGITRPRILHVVNSLGVGGAERLISQLLPRLRERGVQAELYVLSPEGQDFLQPLVDAGIPVHFGTGSVYSVSQLRKLVLFLAKRNFDAIHAHLFPTQLVVAAAVVLAKSNLRLITTEHSTNNRRRRRFLQPLDRWMYSRYAVIVAISSGVRSSLAAWVPTLGSRIRVIENGVPLRENVKNGSGSKVLELVSVGRLVAGKGFDTLIRAVAQNSAVALTIVGEGPVRRELENLVQELSLEDRVSFTGALKDVGAILRRADVYLQGSHYEGFGLAVVEAMAFGLPVVVTDVPGLKEVAGPAGLLFKPGDHAALSNVIMALTRNPRTLDELRARSLARARDFDIEKTADEYSRAYESLLIPSGSVR